jgi:aminoglycoside phosphotransferase (APT) family kinase protein
LAPHDAATRWAIRHLDGQIDVDRALAVWQAALDADPWPGRPVWVHGDLLPGNVVVRRDRLAGVIDWSAAGIGDPACDLMVAWALPPGVREQYRVALDVDEATWARARGWVIEQAVHFIPYYAETIPDAVGAARSRLQAVLSENSTGEPRA